MKVTVDTSHKSTLYSQGEYPVGHITRVVNHYVNKAGWFDKLTKIMKERIEEVGVDSVLGKELIDVLKSADAWWDPSMEDTSRLHSPETCFHLRQSGYGKLGR